MNPLRFQAWLLRPVKAFAITGGIYYRHCVKSGSAGLFRQNTFPPAPAARPGKSCYARLLNPAHMSVECLLQIKDLEKAPEIRNTVWRAVAPEPLKRVLDRLRSLQKA